MLTLWWDRFDAPESQNPNNSDRKRQTNIWYRFIQCVYHLQNMLFMHPSSIMQHLHSVWNFTHCVICVYFSFYFYTKWVCFYTWCVVLDTFSLLCPINFGLCYFVAKSIFCNLRVFGVNFILRKFCLCKRNDKYDVCNEDVGIFRDETPEYERLHDKKYTLPRVPYPLSRHFVLSINQLLYWNKFQTQTFIWKTRQPH